MINSVKNAFSIHSHRLIFIYQILDCSLDVCDVRGTQVARGEETGVTNIFEENGKKKLSCVF